MRSASNIPALLGLIMAAGGGVWALYEFQEKSYISDLVIIGGLLGIVGLLIAGSSMWRS